ncbi:MAG TPA: ABC transporter substrate-binding protein [Chloroflexota bacterium]|nr:ABC transporter substrate-binding protein [Chloroflexota bacterium]
MPVVSLRRALSGIGCVAALGLLGCSAPAQPASSAPAAPPAAAQAASAASAASGTAAAPAPTPWASALTKVRLSYPGTSLGALPVFVAQAEDFYRRYGLDVDAVQMAPNVAMTAMTTGEVPYSMAIGSCISSALKGLPIKVTMQTTDAPYVFLVTRPEIKAAADLRGKTIGTASRGNANDVVMRLMLRKQGLEPERDVAMVVIGETAVTFESMRAGIIDAAPLSPPWVQEGQKIGFNVLMAGADAVDLPMGGVGTSHAKLEQERDEVVRMIMANLEAQRFIRENREGTVDVIMQRLELDRDTAGAAYDSLRSIFGPGDLQRSGLEAAVNTEIELGNIDKAPPLEDIADFTIVPEARRRLGW